MNRKNNKAASHFWGIEWTFARGCCRANNCLPAATAYAFPNKTQRDTWVFEGGNACGPDARDAVRPTHPSVKEAIAESEQLGEELQFHTPTWKGIKEAVRKEIWRAMRAMHVSPNGTPTAGYAAHVYYDPGTGLCGFYHGYQLDGTNYNDKQIDLVKIPAETMPWNRSNYAESLLSDASESWQCHLNTEEAD